LTPGGAGGELPNCRLNLSHFFLMHTNLWCWIAFNFGVLCVLAMDLFGFQRKAHAPSTKEAAVWTAI
jgi:hypothetical protein